MISKNEESALLSMSARLRDEARGLIAKAEAVEALLPSLLPKAQKAATKKATPKTKPVKGSRAKSGVLRDAVLAYLGKRGHECSMKDIVASVGKHSTAADPYASVTVCLRGLVDAKKVKKVGRGEYIIR